MPYISRNTSGWILGILISLLAAVVHAKDERPVKILYFQSPPKAPEKAYVYVAGNMVATTELPSNNFSETFNIPTGALSLRFLPNELPEGGEFPTKAPGVKIPETWSKVLLLVIEDKGNATMPIQVKAINASDNVFGPGSIYMMNMSQIRVGGTVGDKKLDLRPRSIEIIKNPVSENGPYPTKLFAVKKPGDKPQRFIKQMWGHDDTIRKVLFILPKPAPRYATYYSTPIRDF